MSEQNPRFNKDIKVNQLIKEQVQVCIKPESSHGTPKIFCIDTKIKPGCDCDDFKDCHKPGEKCVFTISQFFCIEVPISIDIDVDVDENATCIGKPEFGPCKLCKDSDCQK